MSKSNSSLLDAIETCLPVKVGFEKFSSVGFAETLEILAANWWQARAKLAATFDHDRTCQRLPKTTQKREREPGNCFGAPETCYLRPPLECAHSFGAPAVCGGRAQVSVGHSNAVILHSASGRADAFL